MMRHICAALFVVLAVTAPAPAQNTGEQGVTYREVPAEYGVQGYRYTYVNDRAVIVEPQSRKIVEIID